MVNNNSSDLAQKWRKTDTNSGYATYTNLKAGRCLTGRGITGFPVVTAEKCVAGATNSSGGSASAATSSCASTASWPSTTPRARGPAS